MKRRYIILRGKINMSNRLAIRKSKVYTYKSKVRMVAQIDDIEDEKVIKTRSIWVEIDKKYKKYLCWERADPFVVGVIPYAIRHGYDIFCELPVSEELFHNINEYFLPPLIKYDGTVKPIKVIAETDNTPFRIGSGVGTAISLGVDSFHAITKYLDPTEKSFKLTHLTLYSVGAFPELGTYKKILEVVNKVNLPLIEIRSNINAFVEISFDKKDAYNNSFATLALRKLWKTYYLGSSGWGYDTFNLKKNTAEHCCDYDLLTTTCFSDSELRIYSEAAHMYRLEKMEEIAQHPITHDSLLPCWFARGHIVGGVLNA